MYIKLVLFTNPGIVKERVCQTLVIEISDEQPNLY
jgi:hypothetical protein